MICAKGLQRALASSKAAGVNSDRRDRPVFRGRECWSSWLLHCKHPCNRDTSGTCGSSCAIESVIVRSFFASSRVQLPNAHAIGQRKIERLTRLDVESFIPAVDISRG